MKPIYLTLIGAALAAPCHAALLAHYRFDETSGAVATEEVSGINGTVSGGAIGSAGGIQSITGIDGNALSFSGTTSQRIDADSATWDNLNVATGYTISTWVNWTVGGANNRSVAVSLSADGGGVNDRYADLGVGEFDGANVNADGSGYARIRSSSSIDTNPVIADNPPNGGFDDGNWHLLTGLYSQNSVSVYFDGNLVDSATGTAADVAFDSLTIGLLQRPGGQSDVDPFEGGIDDLQIYDSLLTPTEIQSLFNNPGSVVPEPSTITLLGLLSIGGLLKRRR